MVAGSPHTESSSKRQSKCQQVTILAKVVTIKIVASINCQIAVIDANDVSIREELVGKLEELRGLSYLVCTEVPL